MSQVPSYTIAMPSSFRTQPVFASPASPYYLPSSYRPTAGSALASSSSSSLASQSHPAFPAPRLVPSSRRASPNYASPEQLAYDMDHLHYSSSSSSSQARLSPATHTSSSTSASSSRPRSRRESSAYGSSESKTSNPSRMTTEDLGGGEFSIRSFSRRMPTLFDETPSIPSNQTISARHPSSPGAESIVSYHALSLFFLSFCTIFPSSFADSP